MPLQVLSGLLLAGFFFLILPLLGAFITRGRWRKFRHKLIFLGKQPRFSGYFDPAVPWTGLIYGQIEGIQGSTWLWLRSQGRSIRVNAGNAEVCMFEGQQRSGRRLPEPPVRLRWSHVGAVAEGSRVMVWGQVLSRNGRLQLEAPEGEKGPFLVFYEGDDASLLRRLLGNSRQQNEYWNIFTPFGLLIGFALVAILAFDAFQTLPNRLWGVILTSLALMPFSILLPPGLAAYYVYRRLWRRSRRLRSRRDMLYLVPGRKLERQHLLERTARRLEYAAVGIFALGLVANSVLVFLFSAALAVPRN